MALLQLVGLALGADSRRRQGVGVTIHPYKPHFTSSPPGRGQGPALAPAADHTLCQR